MVAIAPKSNVKPKDKKEAINIPKNTCLLLPGTSVGEQNNTPRAMLTPILISFKK